MTSLKSFKNISDNMMWKKSALAQVEGFADLAERLGTVPVVAGNHTSKSISLPVISLILGKDVFFLRDNFYDINLLVRSHKPVNLSLAEFFDGVRKGLNWDWYLEQISRARSYSWREWTDEQMDDPNLLEVTTEEGIVWDKRQGKKDRWIARMSNPEWWSQDWSAGEITWDGEFGPNVVLFPQPYPFGQGMPKCNQKKYVQGSSEFMIAVRNLEVAEIIIRRISEAE